MSPINLLINALSNTANVITKLQHQFNTIDENEANARHALLYINASMAFYKLNIAAIPEGEFALLVEMIEKLPSDNSLLSELVLHLITINDLLNERAPNEARFRLLDKVLSKLPNSVFEQLSGLKTSASANYIHTNLAKPIKLVAHRVIEKDEIINAFKAAIKTTRIYNDDKEGDAIVTSLEILVATEESPIPPEQQIALTQILINGYSSKRFSEKELSLVIRRLYAQSTEKEAFIKNFLLVYQHSYDSFYRKSERKNVLLRGVATIFPILDEQLPPNQFQQLCSEINFELKDPKASENDDAYYYFKGILSLYSGNKIGDSFVDERAFMTLVYQQENLHPILQALGKNAATDIQLSGSKTLVQLPLLMQTTLLKQHQSLQQEFEKFISLFIQVNQHAPQHQQRNLTLFFSKHHEVIMQMIKLMGIEGIRYMRSHLAGTVLNLERMLESMVILPEDLQQPLAEYFEQNHLSFKQHPEQIHAFKTCLIALGTLINLSPDEEGYEWDEKDEKDEDSLSASEFYLKIAKDKSPQEFLIVLAEILLRRIMQERGVQLSEPEIIKMLERMEPTRFAQLAAASQRMAADEYRDVYLNLLQLDLTGGDIEDFLHNPEQENETGQNLARHNQAIRTKLKTNGISPKTALGYDRIFEFIVLPDNGVNVSQGNLQIVLWTYLNRLKEEAEAALTNPLITNSKNKDRIIAILNCMSELQKTANGIESANSAMVIANVLIKPNAKALVTKIIRNIDALIANKAETSTIFNEFAQHTKDQVDLIEKAAQHKEEGRSPTKISMHYFSVEQWSKEKAMTFFLGDEVGCCLATTNSQFPAMVQRRMDDALLFHVAIDKITGRPAALIWLYLAETQEGKIALVANFFEVNAKYAVNDNLRRALLNGLLKFTQQYCEDNPGIDAFYMNQLSYGWNIRDLDSYPVVDIAIADKLGGPYIPGVTSDQIDMENDEILQQIQSLTRQKYYLVSLDQSRFHKFEPMILARNNKSNAIEKNTIIQKAVVAISEKETSIDKVMKAVIAKHSLELEPFYNTPIEQDSRFIKDVSAALQKAISDRQSHGHSITRSVSAVEELSPVMFFSTPLTPSKDELIAHRHDNPEAQREYDKHFGLILRK